MDMIGAYEAKTHLPKLIERVIKGERICFAAWCKDDCFAGFISDWKGVSGLRSFRTFQLLILMI